jgi:hypothetical protein
MKKHIFKLFALAVISLSFFSSCNTDAEKPMYDVTKTEYAFASTLQSVEMLPTDGNKIIVPIYRNTTVGTSSVNVEMSASVEGLFTLANATATFEDGKAATDIVINYDDINALAAGTTYKLTLSFAEENASPSNVNSITVSAQRKLTFKTIGTGVFTSEFWGEAWEQTLEKAEEANVYRFPDVYFSGYPLVFSIDEAGNVVMSDQECGYVHSTYGMVWIALEQYKIEGNNYLFALNFHVPGLGSFGTAVEAFEMQ